MSANDNAASALDLTRAVDGAIDLIITDFICTVTVGADGACAQAMLQQPGSFDGMPIILRNCFRSEINEIRLPQGRTTASQELTGADPSQLCLFANLSSHAST